MKQKFTFKEPIIDSTQYILGSVGNLPVNELVPSGNWKDYLPDPEVQQKRGIETYDCTGFNTLNAIETLIFRQYGIRVNYSDRWVGIIAGTSVEKGGNDPHVVAEAIRKYGLIPEEMLPFSDDLQSAEEYYSFKGMTKEQIEACYEEGRKWLREWRLGHDWVFRPSQPTEEKINNMKVALKSSPLCVSVYAWAQDQRGVYVSYGQPNHWTSVFAQEQFTNVFDSYDPFIKQVEQDYLYCKRFTILKIDEVKKELGRIAQVLKLLSELVSKLFPPKTTVNPPPEAPISPVVESKPDNTYNEVKEALKYDWSTQEKARHSVRVICDEEGLTVKDKNDLCATVGGESGWRPEAIGKINFDGTRDYGIVQVNEKYWIGKDKLFPSTDYVLNNPEVCVRWMCKQWKAGNKNWWYAYKNGSYKKYMNPVFDSSGKLK